MRGGISVPIFRRTVGSPNEIALPNAAIARDSLRKTIMRHDIRWGLKKQCFG